MMMTSRHGFPFTFSLSHTLSLSLTVLSFCVCICKLMMMLHRNHLVMRGSINHRSQQSKNIGKKTIILRLFLFLRSFLFSHQSTVSFVRTSSRLIRPRNLSRAAAGFWRLDIPNSYQDFYGRNFSYDMRLFLSDKRAPRLRQKNIVPHTPAQRCIRLSAKASPPRPTQFLTQSRTVMRQKWGWTRR